MSRTTLEDVSRVENEGVVDCQEPVQAITDTTGFVLRLH